MYDAIAQEPPADTFVARSLSTAAVIDRDGDADTIDIGGKRVSHAVSRLDNTSCRGKPGGFPHGVLKRVFIKINLGVVDDGKKKGEKR